MEDLSKSVLKDVRRQLKGNKKKINSALRDLSAEAAENRRKKQAIVYSQELFPLLSTKAISRILHERDFVVDAAVELFFAESDVVRTTKATAILSAIDSMPTKARHSVLDANDGNVEATVADLCARLDPAALKDLPPTSVREVLDLVADKFRTRNLMPGMAPGKKGPAADVDRAPPVPVKEEPKAEEKLEDKAAPPLESSSIAESCFVDVTIPDRVDQYNKVPVSISCTSEAGKLPSDAWVGVYKVAETNNRKYISWNRISDLSATLYAPAGYGAYEVRVVSAYVTLGSAILSVGPVVSLEVLRTEDTIAVSHKQLSGNAYPSAWYGLYSREASDRSYLTYKKAGSKGDASTFTLPAKAGTYEVRLFTASYQRVATSAPLLVAGEDSISLTLEESTITVSVDVSSREASSTWVGIYHVLETRNRYYRRYKWLSDPKQTLSFKRLVHHGHYEARLFGKDYELLATSAPIAVDLDKAAPSARILGIANAKVEILPTTIPGATHVATLDLKVDIVADEVQMLSAYLTQKDGTFTTVEMKPVVDEKYVSAAFVAPSGELSSVVVGLRDCKGAIYYIAADPFVSL